MVEVPVLIEDPTSNLYCPHCAHGLALDWCGFSNHTPDTQVPDICPVCGTSLQYDYDKWGDLIRILPR